MAEMEDEVCYSTVVFGDKPKGDKPREDGAVEEAEKTIYTELKTGGDVLPKPCAAATEGEGEPVSSTTPYRLATVCLGLLCALLLAALTALCVYYNVHGSQYNRILERYVNESAARQQLELENTEMVKEMTQLNLTLNSWSSITLNILEFDSFPVSQYCTIVGSVRQCRPCQEGWIQHHSSCYFFMKDDKTLETWEDSRTDCIEKGGHLVIIDNAEEQEFINNHTAFYFDKYHGYWIGLTDPEKKNSWFWTDGTKATSGYWGNYTTDTEYNCASSMPSTETLTSWKPVSCSMANRWICERISLPWPDQLK